MSGQEEGDMVEDDVAMEEDGVPAAKEGRKQKGRGFNKRGDGMDRDFAKGQYESLEQGAGAGPAKSVEGWIILVTGVHEEAQEDDIHEHFAEYGEIKNLHLNLDRRTGFVKGYGLVEYETKKEAQAAIDAMNGTEMLEQTLGVSFAFSKAPLKKRINN
eukprot:CAMPEP_0197574536 /NCGR_PEP_ID=MMETSP1326-20131121/240_1 /TAXON_ID=1155430 /ORGANISM="Genus nov. species nov., Strain RCC2288" /LENGTH=157 /DNA_ID=CAMNT_0043137135 /DNA_START=84 /DNA_END=557 /DNA_ORIENTATION=-